MYTRTNRTVSDRKSSANAASSGNGLGAGPGVVFFFVLHLCLLKKRIRKKWNFCSVAVVVAMVCTVCAANYKLL